MSNFGEYITWPTISIGTFVLIVILAVILRNWIRTIFEWIQTIFGWALTIALWAFPPFLMAIAYAFPQLHEKVTVSPPDFVLRALIFVGLLGIVWFVFQLISAASPNNSYRMLQADLLVSFSWALAFGMFAWGEHKLNDLQFWELVPAMFTVPEALVNSFVAVGNAFQKNPTQMQKGEH